MNFFTTCSMFLVILFSATLVFVELGVIVQQSNHIQSQGDKFPLQTFMFGYFYSPTELNLVRYYLQTSDDGTARSLPDLLGLLYGVLPISVPVLLMVITAGIQVICLASRPSPTAGATRETRSISCTIICLTCLFVLCSCGVLFAPLFKYTELFATIQGDLTIQMRWFYCSSYLLFFLNSALNPVILVSRGQRLQEFCTGGFRRVWRWGESGVSSLRRAVTAEELVVFRSPADQSPAQPDNARHSQCV